MLQQDTILKLALFCKLFPPSIYRSFRRPCRNIPYAFAMNSCILPLEKFERRSFLTRFDKKTNTKKRKKLYQKGKIEYYKDVWVLLTDDEVAFFLFVGLTNWNIRILITMTTLLDDIYSYCMLWITVRRSGQVNQIKLNPINNHISVPHHIII